MKKVEGIPVPNLDTDEIHRLWVLFATVLVPFTIFECIVFYYIYYGKRQLGESESGSHSRSIELKVSQSSPQKKEPEHAISASEPEPCLLTENENIEKDATDSKGLRNSNAEDTSISIRHEQVLVRTETNINHELCSEFTDLLPKRMDAIEGLRIIGAIHIVLFHFYTFEKQKRMCNPCKQGQYWVHVYYMITGLVSYKSCSRTNTPYGGLRLLERRLKTLYPMVFLSCLLTYIGKISANIYVTSITVQRVIFLVSTFTPPFGEARALNGPSWFIGTLTVYWVALPHWCCAAKRASGKGLAIMLLLLYIATWAPHVCWYGILDLEWRNYGRGTWILQGMVNFSPYTNWWHVAFGVCLAAGLDRFKIGKARDLLEKVGASLGVIALTIFIALHKQVHRDIPDLYRMLINGPFSYPILTVLFIGCTQLKDPAARVLKVMGRWGKYALPLYLLHYPINNFLRSGGGCPEVCVENQGALFYFVLLPACLIVGTVIGAMLQDKWVSYISPKKKQR